MKKTIFYLLLIICIVGLSGCTKNVKDINLPKNPIVFKKGQVINPNNKKDIYTSITYNANVYIKYGKIKTKFFSNDINYAFKECIGYSKDNKNERYYLLNEDTNNTWLIKYNVKTKEEPIVLRNVNTKGKKINSKIVKSSHIKYWK